MYNIRILFKFWICVKVMPSFFQKKLILLDVDHTLIDWTNPKTLWDFRSEWKCKLQQSQRAVHLRGSRLRTERPTSNTTSSRQITLGTWTNLLIEYVHSTGHWLAVFSDFPQPLLMNWFEQANLHHIAIGMDSGCLKPLPDGCYHLMSQLGVTGPQTYLIGDGVRTDSRAIYSVGGHFIPIEEIKRSPISTLNTWLR